MIQRTLRTAAAAAATVLITSSFGPAAYADHGHGGDDNGNDNHSGHDGHGSSHPDAVALPNGFGPEDITAGRRHDFFVGSLATGAIFHGSFRGDDGELLVDSADGPTTGLWFDRGRGRHHSGGDRARHGHGGGHHRDLLWAAGGPSGEARVYDAKSGDLVDSWQLAPASSGAFISDVITTRDAAYYTDAFLAQIYVIPLRGADKGVARTLPLTGDVEYQAGKFNLNGLALFGDRLVSAQTVTGELFAIEPTTGETTQIPLADGGDEVTIEGADGIAQDGRRLFIAQNIPNLVAIVKLGRHLDSARLADQISDPALDVPSSVERDRGDLFGLNARFTTPRTTTTTYDVVNVGH